MDYIFPLLVIFNIETVLLPYEEVRGIAYPLNKTNVDEVTDKFGAVIKYHPLIPALLEKFDDEESLIAIVSYSKKFHGAGQLIRLFDWDKYIISYSNLDTRNVSDLFTCLYERTCFHYNRMMYFDKFDNGINVATGLQIFTVKINPESKEGITMDIVDNALKEYTLKVQNETIMETTGKIKIDIKKTTVSSETVSEKDLLQEHEDQNKTATDKEHTSEKDKLKKEDQVKITTKTIHLGEKDVLKEYKLKLQEEERKKQATNRQY